MSKERVRLARQVGVLTTIPFVMLAGPLGGYLLGAWLDRRFGTGSLFLIILVILGTAGSARETYRLIQLAGREEGASKGEEKSRESGEKRERGVSDPDQSHHPD